MASIKKRLAAAVAAAGLALGLGGCMGDYGSGGVGYASDYYGDYGYGAYPGYGPSLAYGGGYGGWYNDFYYPGYGVYVIDRGGRRSRWNDGQRRYWEGRRQQWHAQRGEGRGPQWQGRPGYGRPGYARPNGQRPDWQRGPRQGWQGRPGATPPGATRPDGAPAYAGRRQWRGPRPTPDANAGTPQPSRQGYSGQWRGRGSATGARPPRFEGRNFGRGRGRMGGGGYRGGNRPR